ncbi:MAG: hypothetical protein HUJ30_07030 [Gammaproteobacteria bacterium]|nr:hypothetical protein [Gammaproteobacteria bacterium]
MSYAGSLDANLNDNSVSLTLSSVAGHHHQRGPDALQTQLGYMHNINDNRYVSMGLHVIGETGKSDNPLELGVGGKLIGIDTPSASLLYGLMIGVELRYYPKSVNRLSYSGQLYYGPNVVVSSNADNFKELGLRAEYQILPQAFAYLGYRNVNVGFTGGNDAEIDDSMHVGFRILFQ